MINTKLAYIEPKSISKVSTVLSLIITVIGVIISLIAIGLIVSALPQLNTYISTNISAFIIIGIIIGLILSLVLNYVVVYINALLYNYLLKYFKGIQFELTPYNEIKEIDILPTLTMEMIIMAIWFIFAEIVLILTFSIVISLISSASNIFGNINVATLTANSLTVVTLATLISWVFMSILMFIAMFIFNFFTRRNPLKLDIVENDILELKSIDVISYVMSVGFTLLTIQLIRTLINIMVSGSMEVALLNIVNTIAICIVFTAVMPFLYNIISSKMGGIRFNIEPSSNMIQEYNITNNSDDYDM
jgi:hypothetical protein